MFGRFSSTVDTESERHGSADVNAAPFSRRSAQYPASFTPISSVTDATAPSKSARNATASPSCEPVSHLGTGTLPPPMKLLKLHDWTLGFVIGSLSRSIALPSIMLVVVSPGAPILTSCSFGLTVAAASVHIICIILLLES